MFHAQPVSTTPDEPAIAHGGDLAAARARFPDAPAPWIDLSTGINPHAYDFGVLPQSCFARLPGGDSLAALETTAARCYGAPETVAAPGAQALIQLLPRILPGRRVGVLGPTYEEHALAWRMAGREVAECRDAASLAACDIGVIVNPNNPDGRIVAREEIARLSSQTLLVIDESFADFSPEISFAARAAHADAIVLRSFGKTFGLAGVRLGFAIAAPSRLEALRRELGPWSVSGPAIEIGCRALADSAWKTKMQGRLAQEAARLDEILEGANLRVVGGTTLFRLAENDASQDVADLLGRAGILVRRFANRPELLRFGLPSAEGWARLEQALATVAGTSA